MPPSVVGQQPTLPNLHRSSINGLRKKSLPDQSHSLAPPTEYSAPNSRHTSREYPSTPQSTRANASTEPSPTDSSDKKKKHWWNRSSKDEDEEPAMKAWIAGHPQQLSYDIQGLANAAPAQELWDNTNGNCYVYLFPRLSGKGASFKVDSSIFASSPVLTRLVHGEIYSSHPTDRRTTPPPRSYDPNTPPISPKRLPIDSQVYAPSPDPGRQEVHLFLPIKLSSDAPLSSTPPKSDGISAQDDLQTLVDYRNFIAFLCGSSLVATERRNSFFNIFMTIAGMLKQFQFSNVDGSTYGEVANASFDGYVEELGLADVRNSREKIIEGIVLGEHMKNVALYNEAFTHAVGRHQEILALKSSRFMYVSPVTSTRLARAYMDLEKRTASIRLILTDFDFPFLFSGIMSSKTSGLRKQGVRFDSWKESFLGMRKFIIGTYKQRYGDWPPKASSKKNALETSGLNRLVLRDMYHDLSSLYDLLVDRTRLTTRTIDGVDLSGGLDEPQIRGLRAVLSEYDRSSPPVKPPVPFDLPRLPSAYVQRSAVAATDPKKAAKEAARKLKDEELARVLRASWNPDAHLTPFVDAFRDLERRAAHNCTAAELDDLRLGQWIFMYVVLQALPMLACDAPGLRHTRGVEYFLCEPPRSGVPWAADPNLAGAARRTWFSVGGEGGGVVALPADVVEHGVEGIYRRSHCWQMAERWSASNPLLNEALHEHQQYQQQQQQQPHTGAGGVSFSDLPAPPPYPASSSGSAGLLGPDSRASSVSSLANTSKRLSTLGLGLEALPLPRGVTPDGSRPAEQRPRTPQHAVDANMTFDAILANVGAGANGGKGQGRKKK